MRLDAGRWFLGLVVWQTWVGVVLRLGSEKDLRFWGLEETWYDGPMYRLGLGAVEVQVVSV